MRFNQSGRRNHISCRSRHSNSSNHSLILKLIWYIRTKTLLFAIFIKPEAVNQWRRKDLLFELQHCIRTIVAVLYQATLQHKCIKIKLSFHPLLLWFEIISFNGKLKNFISNDCIWGLMQVRCSTRLYSLHGGFIYSVDWLVNGI